MKRLKKRLFIKRWSTMNDTPCAFSLLNNEKLIQYSLNLQVNALILISVSTIFIYQMLHNNILKHRIKGRKFLKMLIAIYICFIKSEFFLLNSVTWRRRTSSDMITEAWDAVTFMSTPLTKSWICAGSMTTIPIISTRTLVWYSKMTQSALTANQIVFLECVSFCYFWENQHVYVAWRRISPANQRFD